jgi:hypothetical protein
MPRLGHHPGRASHAESQRDAHLVRPFFDAETHPAPLPEQAYMRAVERLTVTGHLTIETSQADH